MLLKNIKGKPLVQFWLTVDFGCQSLLFLAITYNYMTSVTTIYRMCLFCANNIFPFCCFLLITQMKQWFVFLWQLGSWWVGGGVLHSCYDVAPREVVTQVCQERFNLNDLSIILAFRFFLFAYFLSSVNLVGWWINCKVNNTNCLYHFFTFHITEYIFF